VAKFSSWLRCCSCVCWVVSLRSKAACCWCVVVVWDVCGLGLRFVVGVGFSSSWCMLLVCW